MGNLFGAVDVQLQYLFQTDIPDFSALCHFWTACQAASIQSWKLGEEASWRISGSGKVSNFANINFWKSKPSQSTSTLEQPTCGSEWRSLCQGRWISNTTKFASSSNTKGSSGNPERLKAWLQINLEGTFTREILWLWSGQCATRAAGRKIPRGELNARSQHRRTSILPEDLLRQRRPPTTSPSRTRRPIKIQPGGT